MCVGIDITEGFLQLFIVLFKLCGIQEIKGFSVCPADPLQHLSRDIHVFVFDGDKIDNSLY